MRRKGRVAIVAALAFGAAFVLPVGAEDNWLLGSWTLAKGDCSAQTIQFTEDAMIYDSVIAGMPPTHYNTPVRYVSGGDDLLYVDAGASHTPYQLLSEDRMLEQTAYLCEYTRN